MIERHGLRKHPLYSTWSHMKQRCLNPKRPQYPDYGGRGIRVCPRWENSFLAFYHDMLPTWEPGLLLDRRNNDGDYTPDNCRWVTPKVSASNRRSRRVEGEVPFKGVSYHRRDRKYRATICIGKDKVYLGNFNTPEEASEAYQLAARQL